MTNIAIQTDNTTTDRDSKRSSSSSTAIYSSSTVHGAGHVLTPWDMEAIREGYVDILGSLNAIKARDIEAAISCGLDAGAILDALEQTALATRPSHAYFRTIIRRYMAEGIHTANEAEEAREIFRAKREAANRERWNAWYKDPADDFPF